LLYLKVSEFLFPHPKWSSCDFQQKLLDDKRRIKYWIDNYCWKESAKPTICIRKRLLVLDSISAHCDAGLVDYLKLSSGMYNPGWTH
jgi:hypothetical protein